jgi:hypothetical protein
LPPGRPKVSHADRSPSVPHRAGAGDPRRAQAKSALLG